MIIGIRAKIGREKDLSHELQTSNKRTIWRKKPRIVAKSGSVAVYAGVFLGIISMVAIGYQPPQRIDAVASSVSTSTSRSEDKVVNVSVDDLVSTSVAANVAQSVDLPVAANVANMSQSMAAESMLSQNDTNIVSKPQIVQPSVSGREIKTYVAQVGDSVQSIASQFNISSDTVKWANNMTSDAVEPGRELKILPADGILYKAKAGDTIESIASKYSSSAEQIRTLNDLELRSITEGQEVLVPNGNLPDNERPGYVAPTTYSSNSYSSGYALNSAYATAASAGNRYAFGNCTWYAYERRVQLGLAVGSFWGNAATWAAYASSAGLRVDGNPEPGAIMQNGGGYGHVAIVEAVNPGVSVTISEMNGYRWGGGFNRVGQGDIPWDTATSGMYRYIH